MFFYNVHLVLGFFFYQNEDERSPSESANPPVVNISNPCYSGYAAFTEPFGVSDLQLIADDGRLNLKVF